MAAIYPVISIAAGNSFDTSLVQLLVVSTAFALAGVAVYAAVLAVLPARLSTRAAALVGLSVTAWLFDAQLVADRAHAVGLRSRDAMIILTIVAASLTVGLLRTSWGLVRLTQAAGIFGVLLIAWSVAIFAGRRAAIDHAMHESAFYRRLTRPLPPATSSPKVHHDFYILILDQYANEVALAERYGFDDHPFTDSLRSRGFAVARDSRSNYGWTPWSLASLMSGEHLTDMERDPDGRIASWDILYSSIRHSRILAAFRRAGYRVYLVPSAYFPGTRETAVGETYLPADARSPRARLARVPLAVAAWESSVVGRVLQRMGWNLTPASVAIAPFDGLIELASRPGPKVVIAHSLIAHPPYQFLADCSARAGQTGEESAYTDQVQCTNRQALRVVTEIERTDSTAIILLIADHGSASHGLPIDEPAEALDSARARERFGAFRAQRVPANIAIDDSMTPINVMREIVRSELGIVLPAVADSSYWSSFMQPAHTVAVDSLLLIRGPR